MRLGTLVVDTFELGVLHDIRALAAVHQNRLLGIP